MRERRSSGLGAWTVGLLAAFALLFAFAVPAMAAPTFPPLTGRVVDNAHVLTPEITAALTQKLAALQQKNGRQVIVVTLASLQGDDIEDYGYQLGRAWGIGQKGKDDGALFIVVPGEKKVRIEVGYGLEPVLTDALSSVILQTQVLPHFRDGDIPGGITAGTDAIVQQLGLSDADAKQQVAQAVERPRPRHHETIGSIFSLLLILFVIGGFLRGGRRGGGMGWALPLMFLGGAFGGRDRDDDWGGGGGGGGGDSFGGGGGGSFGGGGSSGSW